MKPENINIIYCGSKATLIDKLLDDLDVISQLDIDQYQRLEFEKIQAISKQGTPNGAVKIDDIWYPKSQLRTDPDGNVWVSHWFLSKF